MNFQLPLLYEGFDRQRARPGRSNEIEAKEVEFDGGEDQYFPGSWTQVDRRPTKEEALERLEDFNLVSETVDYLVPDEISNNLPYWIRLPWSVAPEVAEVLIDWDPLDRIQD